MRLSASLIAVCATTMALATPLAAANDSIGGSDGSSLTVGHLDVSHSSQAKEDTTHEENAGTAQGTTPEKGTSPEKDSEKEKEAAADAAWQKMPEWLQSARPSDTTKEVFAWLTAIFGLLAAGINALVLIAKANPSILDGPRDFLESRGITVN